MESESTYFMSPFTDFLSYPPSCSSAASGAERKEKTGFGTGLSCAAESCPVMLPSDMKSGGSGGNCELGSRRDGGAKPAIPEPSNMPETEVTQQKGENDP